MPAIPTMGNCCGTCSRGHKGTVAKKTWHGRFGYDGECTDAILASPQTTKYLSKRITLSMHSEANSSDDYWTGFIPGIVDPVHCEANGEFAHDRTVKAVVNRYSGVLTLEDCLEDKSGPTYTGGCDTGGYSSVTSASTAFDDILCGPPSYATVEWADIFSMLTACDGEIWTLAPECAATQTDWLTPRTPTEIEEYYNGTGGNYTTNTSEERVCQTTGTHVFVTSHTTVVSTCACTLDATHINLHLETEVTVDGDSYMRTDAPTLEEYGSFLVECELPTSSHYHVKWVVDLVIELGTPYTSADLVEDVEDMLALRPLTDDTHYVFHYGCTYPLITYDEVETIVTPDDFDHGNCAYADPNATTGGISGTGYTGSVIGGSGAVTQWSGFGAGVAPDGAFQDYGQVSGSQLSMCKYAEILATRPAHNWYRPCGNDRNLTNFIATTRYPDAWPICGSLVVSGATNATPIEITTTTDNYLQTGDVVDITGVGGNTAANGTDWVVTVIDATHFTLDGSAGSGTYTSGGIVENAASTSPPLESWNDDASTGDYLTREYTYDFREVAIDVTIRENNALYGFSPAIAILTVSQENLGTSGTRVVCYSPNAEDFGVNSETFPFPAFVADWRYGARWVAQVQQRMRNPINMVVNTDHVEARNSKPSLAPDLPSFDNGGIQTDGCDFQNNEPHICPYVNILTIAEITAYADAVVGGIYPVTEGVVSAPLFTCSAFDDDVP